MSKQYAEFKVGDLFDITPTKWYKNVPVVENEISTPQVSNTTQPNGITSFEKYPANNDGNVITFSDTTVGGETLFYQPVDFVGYSHVQKMIPVDFELNQRKAHYVISAFRKAVDGKFNYAAKFNRENALNTFITLPITDASVDTDSPEPDWEYMEEYIKEIEQKYLETVEQYNRRDEEILDTFHPDYHDEEPEACDYAEFRVGDLFEIIPTKWYKNDPVVEEEISVPQVSNTTQPNGITSFEKYPANNDGNVITFSDTTVGGETLFYQPVDFIGYSHVQKMIPIDFEMNQKIAHYVISAFRKAVDGKFNYAAKFNRENASNTLITLPVTSDGKPDWGFMEDYISFIEGGGEAESQTTCSERGANLKATHSEVLVEPEFKEFEIGELFEVNNLAYFDIKDVSEGNGKPLVSTRTTQNGYQFFSSEEEHKVHKGNVITLSAHSAQFFYQPIDFISVSHMYSIYHEKMNRKVGMYLVSAFYKLTSKQFNFSQKLTGKRFSNMKISLPATPSGDPDWEYMENYIRMIEQQEKRKISNYVEHKRNNF